MSIVLSQREPLPPGRQLEVLTEVWFRSEDSNWRIAAWIQAADSCEKSFQYLPAQHLEKQVEGGIIPAFPSYYISEYSLVSLCLQPQHHPSTTQLPQRVSF